MSMGRISKRSDIARAAILCCLAQRKATTAELAEAIGEHINTTKGHLEALRQRKRVVADWRFGGIPRRRRYLVWALAPEVFSIAVAA